MHLRDELQFLPASVVTSNSNGLSNLPCWCWLTGYLRLNSFLHVESCWHWQLTCLKKTLNSDLISFKVCKSDMELGHILWPSDPGMSIFQWRWDGFSQKYISLSWAFLKTGKTWVLTPGQNDDPVTHTWKMTHWPGDPMTQFHVWCKSHFYCRKCCYWFQWC